MTRNTNALDAEQLAEIYQRYGHIVFRVCRDILRQESDAEDATQEVFLKFWRYAEQLRNPHEFLAVLKRIAVSCSIDLLRSRSRRNRYGESWKDLQNVIKDFHEKQADEQMIRSQMISTLFRDVRTDDDTLHMAYLYYFDEMTLEEVASTTGFSRRAVGMKLDRFRELALKYCRNHGIFD